MITFHHQYILQEFMMSDDDDEDDARLLALQPKRLPVVPVVGLARPQPPPVPIKQKNSKPPGPPLGPVIATRAAPAVASRPVRTVARPAVVAPPRRVSPPAPARRVLEAVLRSIDGR
jgi:hypothetical protein